MNSRVSIVQEGILNLIVCAENDVTDKEILEVCNNEIPCGTTNGWCRVVRENEEDNMLPVQCSINFSRTHFVVLC